MTTQQLTIKTPTRAYITEKHLLISLLMHDLIFIPQYSSRLPNPPLLHLFWLGPKHKCRSLYRFLIERKLQLVPQTATRLNRPFSCSANCERRNCSGMSPNMDQNRTFVLLRVCEGAE